MDRAIESGLELKPFTGLEVGSQPDDKYYIGGGGSNHLIPNHPDQSDQSHAKSGGRFRVVWMLAVILVLFLAVASGVGLGTALTFKHRSNPSR